MKENNKLKRLKKKKLIKAFFVVAFFLICGIMYTNSHEGKLSQQISSVPEKKEKTVSISFDELPAERPNATEKPAKSGAGQEKRQLFVEKDSSEKKASEKKASEGKLAKGFEDMGQETVEKNSAASKVDINTAGVEELKTLKGIGDSKAAAIIKFRETEGVFSCIEDIMKVSGIKEGTFAKIKDRIEVNR